GADSAKLGPDRVGLPRPGENGRDLRRRPVGSLRKNSLRLPASIPRTLGHRGFFRPRPQSRPRPCAGAAPKRENMFPPGAKPQLRCEYSFDIRYSSFVIERLAQAMTNDKSDLENEAPVPDLLRPASG